MFVWALVYYKIKTIEMSNINEMLNLLESLESVRSDNWSKFIDPTNFNATYLSKILKQRATRHLSYKFNVFFIVNECEILTLLHLKSKNMSHK